MISRRAAIAIADAYTGKFSYSAFSYSGTVEVEKVDHDSFYDFLYEHEYEAWFCNMVQHIFGVRGLKEWLMQIHTGESFINATPNWPWEKRQALGQSYLKNLARDFIVWYRSQTDHWIIEQYKESHDEMLHRLEIDGYVFRDNDLYKPEGEVLDVEAETGLLENLYKNLTLADRQQTFEFLKLTEEHYVGGRWSDSISNARKFFEAVLKQVAAKHAARVKGTTLSAATLDRPIDVRKYLESEALLERKEREAVDKIYGLLSHTGSHPYMAEKDQARLLRQLCLTITQFIMLRLEGALKKT
jgi:hypothetical protein